MDGKSIIEALGSVAGSSAQPTPDCLEPWQLAAWIDDGLDHAQREAAEAHLADCDFCLGQLAAILRSADESSAGSLPTEVIKQAERLAEIPKGRFRPSLGWAAAAMIVLAVGMLSSQWTGYGPLAGRDDLHQTRYADRQSLQPRLIAPRDGSVIRPLEQVFRWTPVPGSLFYDIQLVSADGDLLLRERVDDTRWLIPEGLALEPGADYYVRVDAYLSDAKFLSSEHVLFSVDGRE